jgi:succinate dehydrogenase / fumarate reductase cytochrome b subunit
LGVWGWIDSRKYNLERYLYTLQRVTGMLILLYLFMHIFVTGYRISGKATWDNIMATLNNPTMHVFEFLLLTSVIFHSLNGFRLILSEFGFGLGKPHRLRYPYTPSSLGKRSILLAIVIVGLVLALVVAIEYLYFV